MSEPVWARLSRAATRNYATIDGDGHLVLKTASFTLAVYVDLGHWRPR
jgi:hypothetical protein